MGFPSPATDYVEERISLDKMLITHPSATYFMRASHTYWRAGIQQGSLLIVDRSLSACDGTMVVCNIAGEFCLRRYRLHPQHQLEHLTGDGRREKLEAEDSIFGVITHIISDARTLEFDDNPVM